MIINPGSHHFDPNKRIDHVLDANGTKTVLINFSDIATPASSPTDAVLSNNPAAVVDDA